MAAQTTLSRERIIHMVAENVFTPRILNNSHRGDVVEMMVLAALGPEWQFVGLGWHPWDLQRGSGPTRIRMQVKQSAALQLWGATKRPSITFNWSKKPPSYIARDNPNEEIELEGWFCDIFVVGVHRDSDRATVDQVDPRQWEFLILASVDLPARCNSMTLTKALAKWELFRWAGLKDGVENAIARLGRDKLLATSV
jgi:hypothetical protein